MRRAHEQRMTAAARTINAMQTYIHTHGQPNSRSALLLLIVESIIIAFQESTDWTSIVKILVCRSSQAVQLRRSSRDPDERRVQLPDFCVHHQTSGSVLHFAVFCRAFQSKRQQNSTFGRAIARPQMFNLKKKRDFPNAMNSIPR